MLNLIAVGNIGTGRSHPRSETDWLRAKSAASLAAQWKIIPIHAMLNDKCSYTMNEQSMDKLRGKRNKV